jgi:hypothetical protein
MVRREKEWHYDDGNEQETAISSTVRQAAFAARQNPTKCRNGGEGSYERAREKQTGLEQDKANPRGRRGAEGNFYEEPRGELSAVACLLFC